MLLHGVYNSGMQGSLFKKKYLLTPVYLSIQSVKNVIFEVYTHR